MDRNIEDIPMRLSRKFEPLVIQEELLPDLPPQTWMREVSILPDDVFSHPRNLLSRSSSCSSSMILVWNCLH